MPSTNSDTSSAGQHTTLNEYLHMTKKNSSEDPYKGFSWRDNFVSPMRVTSASAVSSEENEKSLRMEKNLVLLPTYDFQYAKQGGGWYTVTVPTKPDIGTAYAITKLMSTATVFDSPKDVKTVVDWLTTGAMRRTLNLDETSDIISRVNSGERFTSADLDLNKWLDTQTFKYVSGYLQNRHPFNLKMKWHHSILEQCVDHPSHKPTPSEVKLIDLDEGSNNVTNPPQPTGGSPGEEWGDYVTAGNCT